MSIAPAYSIGKSSYHDYSHLSRPGPGDYELSSIIRSKLPSYSFSKSPRKIHNTGEIPGPGVYNPSSPHKTPGFSLSRSPRILSNVRNFSPGPGDYNYSVFQSKYQYSISKARRRIHSMSEVPGPGSYNPSPSGSLENTPRVKFQKQPRMPNQSFLTPAPGQYELPNIYKTNGYTIPKAAPMRKHSTSPGPGVYEIPRTIGIASLKN